VRAFSAELAVVDAQAEEGLLTALDL